MAAAGHQNLEDGAEQIPWHVYTDATNGLIIDSCEKEEALKNKPMP
jgi:hypothetical protein